MTAITAATIASSTDMRLQAIAGRVHSGGPDVLLRLLRTTLTASDPMDAFERIGAATLPVPAQLTLSDRKPQPPILRLVSRTLAP